MNLYDALTQYTSSDAYPFHMPGHKRRSAHLCDPARIDLTEIDGFDNLHHAEGILRDAQERAAALYGSSETHFLVNGSTAGILSAIGALSKPDDCLLMARNSHRSAFNAAALSRVRTAYLYPGKCDRESSPDHYPADNLKEDSFSSLVSSINAPIDPMQVAYALDHLENVCAVFLTSPTYDGVVSDVAKIAQIAHSHGVPVIVDEAHGAHFGIHDIFPESSVKLGADLVIHSLHKTLPALTQTALIHVNGPLVDRRKLRHLLSVYQTSSPSYVLMASIDQCIRLLTEEGNALFDAYAKRLQDFYVRTKLSHLSFLRTDDPSRILIRPGDSNAMQLYHTLRERFHLQPEMVTPHYVLMLSSVCDDDEGFERLSEALLTLDEELGREYAAASVKPAQAHRMVLSEDMKNPGFSLPAAGLIHGRNLIYPVTPPSFEDDVCCTIAQALETEAEAVSFSRAEGRISAEYLFCYPPGVPLLVPGERIRAGIFCTAKAMLENGYSMQGLDDRSLQFIRVICKKD